MKKLQSIYLRDLAILWFGAGKGVDCAGNLVGRLGGGGPHASVETHISLIPSLFFSQIRFLLDDGEERDAERDTLVTLLK